MNDMSQQDTLLSLQNHISSYDTKNVEMFLKVVLAVGGDCDSIKEIAHPSATTKSSTYGCKGHEAEELLRNLGLPKFLCFDYLGYFLPGGMKCLYKMIENDAGIGEATKKLINTLNNITEGGANFDWTCATGKIIPHTMSFIQAELPMQAIVLKKYWELMLPLLIHDKILDCIEYISLNTMYEMMKSVFHSDEFQTFLNQVKLTFGKGHHGKREQIAAADEHLVLTGGGSSRKKLRKGTIILMVPPLLAPHLPPNQVSPSTTQTELPASAGPKNPPHMDTNTSAQQPAVSAVATVATAGLKNPPETTPPQDTTPPPPVAAGLKNPPHIDMNTSAQQPAVSAVATVATAGLKNPPETTPPQDTTPPPPVAAGLKNPPHIDTNTSAQQPAVSAVATVATAGLKNPPETTPPQDTTPPPVAAEVDGEDGKDPARTRYPEVDDEALSPSTNINAPNQEEEVTHVNPATSFIDADLFSWNEPTTFFPVTPERGSVQFTPLASSDPSLQEGIDDLSFLMEPASLCQKFGHNQNVDHTSNYVNLEASLSYWRTP
eukprot:scaffold8514_cov74-Skeletonema_dohrnii-CCMP3373.AAC.4